MAPRQPDQQFHKNTRPGTTQPTSQVYTCRNQGLIGQHLLIFDDPDHDFDGVSTKVDYLRARYFGASLRYRLFSVATKWENSKIQTSFPLAASSAVSKATIYLQEYGPAKANLLNGFVKLNDILTHAKLEHDSWHVLRAI